MKKALRFGIYSVYLTLTFLSVILMSADFAEQSPALGVVLLALSCTAGYAVSGFVRARKALICIGCAVLAAAGAVFLLPYGSWNGLMAILYALCVLLAGRHDWSETDTRLIDPKWIAVGIVLSVVTYLVALLNVREVCRPQIGYALYGYLAVSVLLVNLRSVQNNAAGQARRMMRGNQALACGFVAVMTLAVFFEPLQQAVGNGLRWLISAFFDLFAGKGEMSSVESAGQPAQQMDLSMLGGQEKVWPEWLQRLGEILIYAVATAVLLALAVGLMRFLYKEGRNLLKWLAEWLRGFGTATDEEYAEESEQLMSAQSIGKQLREDAARRIKRLFRPPVRWGSLTPTQRVRFLYRHVLEKQQRIASDAENLTPEELCIRAEKAQTFAQLYDRARYAGEEITAQEAETYREYLKN